MYSVDTEEAEWLRSLNSGEDWSEVLAELIEKLTAGTASAGELSFVADRCWSAGETQLATRLRRKLEARGQSEP